MEYSIGEKLYMKKSLELLLFKPISSDATYLILSIHIKIDRKLGMIEQ